MGFAINPSAVYGLSRAANDVEERDMQRQAFATDQAIRAERLGQERELAPIRRRGLEQGIEQSQQAIESQRRLGPLQEETARQNLNTARLNYDERARLDADLAEARRKKIIINAGLTHFNLTMDPQPLMNALGEAYPQYKGAKAEMNRDDGTITLALPGQEPRVIRPEKRADGTVVQPQEILGGLVSMVDPIKDYEEGRAAERKRVGESQKQEAITERSIHRDLSRERVRADDAERRADSERRRRLDLSARTATAQVDKLIKGTPAPGGGFTYNDPFEKFTEGAMKAEAGKMVRDDDAAPEEAARASVQKVRASYTAMRKKIADIAVALRKKKIDPQSKTAVQGAIDKGDQDAKELLTTLGALQKALREHGADVDRAMEHISSGL